jgi:hypothetical protein
VFRVSGDFWGFLGFFDFHEKNHKKIRKKNHKKNKNKKQIFKKANANLEPTLLRPLS